MKRRSSVESPMGDIIAAILVSLFLLAVGAWLTVSTAVPSFPERWRCTAQTSGTVRDVRYSQEPVYWTRGRLRNALCADGSFVFEAGGQKYIRAYHVTMRYASDPKVQKGDSLPVRYDPSDPDHYYIPGQERTLWHPLFLAVFLSLVVVSWVIGKRERGA